MDVGAYVALGLLTLLLVAGQLLFPNRWKKIDRALAAQPRTNVEEARGAVRLTGRVGRTDDLLTAPLSGRRCVAFEILVDGPGYSDGERMTSTRRLVEAREARPFLVADESGEARIDTSGPYFVSLSHDRNGSTSWYQVYPGKHRELALVLESAGIVAKNWVGGWKPIRWAEGVLEVGERVSVGGFGAREVDPTGHRPDLRSQPERLVLRGTEELPLLISDGRAATG